MRRADIHHPIHAAIEDIWSSGHTPRIQVDARREDVVVPDSVRAKWGSRLVLDLDASWPLNLEAGTKGLQVDLAFQGHVTRCTLPWESIYVVLDRTTGRGVVIESHLPKDEELAPPPAKPALRGVAGGREDVRGEAAGSGAGSSEAGSSEAGSSEGSEARSSEVDSSEPGPSDAALAGAASSEDEAKRRRARFKVIDGGR